MNQVNIMLYEKNVEYIIIWQTHFYNWSKFKKTKQTNPQNLRVLFEIFLCTSSHHKKLLHDHTGKFKYFWLPYDYLLYNSKTKAYRTRQKNPQKELLIFHPYLMSPCERCVPVHIIFWLADINHLIGVQLEHALHLQLTAAVLRLVRGAFGHSLLLQLLPSSLALPYPSQIPKGQRRSRAMNNTDQRYRKFLDYATHKKNTSLFFFLFFF